MSAHHDDWARRSRTLAAPHACVPAFLQLEVPEEELLRRVKALAAAQAAAESAAAAASSKSAAGACSSSAAVGKKPSSAVSRSSTATAAAAAALVSSGAATGVTTSSSPHQRHLFAAAHNTVKDLLRRMDAHKQLQQEDAADLAAKVGCVCAGPDCFLGVPLQHMFTPFESCHPE